MEKDSRIKIVSRILLVIGAVCIIAAIFLPMWQIELYAPQYPEGLELLIYPDTLAGDVDVINGLNHYIGMKTLHTEDFIEFTILPYLLGFFALLFLIVAILGRKKYAYILFGLFLLFSIVSMVDFYRWNYEYGHNLDPHAAIKVPGMAYQPPLLGYKQLLNFGAYSIPDTGGYLFILAGLFLLFIVIMESGLLKKIFRKRKHVAAVIILFFVMAACSDPGPKAINVNVDECAFCKMSITNPNFAAQLITVKGRHYIFDDVSCMVDYAKANKETENRNYYAADFLKADLFVDLDQAFMFQSDSLRSPMGGNIATFATRDSMIKYRDLFAGSEITWHHLMGKK